MSLLSWLLLGSIGTKFWTLLALCCTLLTGAEWASRRRKVKWCTRNDICQQTRSAQRCACSWDSWMFGANQYQGPCVAHTGLFSNVRRRCRGEWFILVYCLCWMECHRKQLEYIGLWAHMNTLWIEQFGCLILRISKETMPSYSECFLWKVLFLFILLMNIELYPHSTNDVWKDNSLLISFRV